MANIPVNAAAFAVCGMQVFSAESFGAGWPKRAMRAARGVFPGSRLLRLRDRQEGQAGATGRDGEKSGKSSTD